MSFIMGFTISTTSNCGLTLISNSFIQNHMPSANGNFVKIYLYLVMLCQHADTAGNSSIDALADCFECTESDILRALRYWQKEGLLTAERAEELKNMIEEQFPDRNNIGETNPVLFYGRKRTGYRCFTGSGRNRCTRRHLHSEPPGVYSFTSGSTDERY